VTTEEAEVKNQVVQSAARWTKQALTISVLVGTLHCLALYAQTSKPIACSAAAYREFDFWLGEWDVFEEGGSTREARATVTRIQNDCGLREQYDGADGSSGESMSMYDPSTGEWQQTWLSNRGQVVFIQGTLQGQAMILSGTDHHAGSKRLVRGVWKPESAGVRETAETSADGGKTWTPWFDLSFRKHSALVSHDNNGSDEDRRAVSALDTQFQAAVKNNDVGGMGRILADDYILVLSSGKTQTKADLLNEAREGKTTYERQEDTNQTVRLWGDTAVVTAKLWAKGTDGEKPFDVTLWFSDTYVRSPAGWKYVFGQAACHQPPAR
jgi:ketosteroid isomerase-like protein